MSPTANTIKTNIIMRLNSNFRNNQSQVSSENVNDSGANIIWRNWQWINEICIKLAGAWSAYHFGWRAFLINVQQMQTGYIGLGGTGRTGDLGFTITRLFDAPHFNTHCTAFEIFINKAFNTFKNSYNFNNIIQYNSNDIGQINIPGNFSVLGNGSTSDFSSMNASVNSYLLGNNFSNPLMNDTLNFNYAVCDAVISLFNTWKSSHNWLNIPVTIIQGGQHLANGGNIA